jgi:ribosomal protein S18 acetylase RimI-like enzyme
VTDAELYRRGIATLLASWEAYARCVPDAALHRRDGVAAAVFPSGPARDIYNNAVLERADAIDMMESMYAAAGVTRYAVWAREGDAGSRAALAARGYLVAESTRAMGRTLDAVATPPAIDLAAPRWSEHLRLIGVSADLLGATGDAPPGVRVVVGRDGTGASVATAHVLDHAGDCGIYNVGTVEGARRRGHGGALTARLLADAAARGCTTASLQSSPMAEGVYAAAGFHDLGRILEYVPAAAAVRWHDAERAALRPLFALADDSAAQLDRSMDAGRVLVAVDDDEVVGHLQLVDHAGADRGAIEITNMAVAEDRQGQGLGRALVERAIAEARAAGAATLLVATATADVGNLRFYQRLGFRLLRVERDAFTAAEGYADDSVIDGIPLRDRVWLSLAL